MRDELDWTGQVLEFGVRRVTPRAPGQRPSYAQLTKLIGHLSLVMEKVSWTKSTVWLDKAQTTGFKGVREDVSNFQSGGYQVCEKWPKDRKRRKLPAEDRTCYQKVFIALSETILLIKEIDQVIALHGGWPAAFAAQKGVK